MMQALEQSRQQNPVSSSGPNPGTPPQPSGNPGVPADMQKYWSMMQDMNSKIDKILQTMSANYTGKQLPPDESQNDSNDGNEGKY